MRWLRRSNANPKGVAPDGLVCTSLKTWRGLRSDVQAVSYTEQRGCPAADAHARDYIPACVETIRCKNSEPESDLSPRLELHIWVGCGPRPHHSQRKEH